MVGLLAAGLVAKKNTDFKIVEWLLEKGADCNLQNNNKYTLVNQVIASFLTTDVNLPEEQLISLVQLLLCYI